MPSKTRHDLGVAASRFLWSTGTKLRIDLLRREKEGDEQGDGESPKIIQMVTMKWSYMPILHFEDKPIRDIRKKKYSWLAVILWMWLTIWIPDTEFFSAWWIEKNEDGYLKNSSSTVPTLNLLVLRGMWFHVPDSFFSRTTRLPWPSFNWSGGQL